MHLRPSAKYWHDRAEEATTMAGAMRDPLARKLMLDAAAEYAERAQRAETDRSGEGAWAIPYERPAQR
jgi:hypothetical protein